MDGSRHMLVIGVLAVALGTALQPVLADQLGGMTYRPLLDGMSFTGMLGPDGKPKDVADRFVFSNGTFVSKECKLRCNYPARPYFVHRAGDAVEFVSTTRCPYKDATIEWQGTVKGDRIDGVATWTINRWYWTIEKRYEFSGQLDRPVPAISSAD